MRSCASVALLPSLGLALLASAASQARAATPAFCPTLPEWRAMFASPGGGHGDSSRRLPELLLDATINGDPAQTSVQAVCLADGRLALIDEDWRAMRLRPVTPVPLADGRAVEPLEAAPGLRYAVDTLAQTITMSIPAADFEGGRIEGRSESETPPPPSPMGGYLTYDATVSIGSRGQASFGANLEAATFGRWGLLYSGGALTSTANGDMRFVRGDTYWQKSSVASMATLTIGDAIGVGGGWSRPIHFAGIRYGRDFSTRPGFITFPMPTVAGSAALPSTVEVLVNNLQRMNAKVPAGPFDFAHVPIMSGAGQFQLVVTDLLGRQTVLTQSYYVDQHLLEQGLSDFSYEAGAERLNYGQRSFDYGRPMADATYRRGLTPWLTTEIRAEAESNRGALGFEVLSLVGKIGAVSAAAGYAVSRGEAGGTYRAGFQSVGQGVTYNLGWQHFDRGYRPFASLDGENRPRDEIFVGGGVQAGGLGSFTAGSVYRSRWAGPTQAYVNLGWSRHLMRGVNLGLWATKAVEARAWTALLTINVDLGPKGTVTSQLTAADTGRGADVTAASPVLSGPGLSWVLRANTDSPNISGGAIYNTEAVRLTADLAKTSDGVAARLGAAGSVGMVSGYPFASLPIQTSFALVRTGGVSGAPIMRWNQVAAKTRRDGVALITDLNAYEDNKISVDPTALPMDVEVDGDTLYARAWPRAGVFVDFPIRRTRGALIILRMADGSDVPLGATVTLREGGSESRVAERGEVWVTDLKDQNQLRVTWRGGSCSTSVSVPKSIALGDKLGPVTCLQGDAK